MDLQLPHVPVADVVVDGDPSDAGWAAGAQLPAFVVYSPVPGAAPVAPTEVTVLADDRALYVRIVAADPAPSTVRAGLGRRDSREGDDIVTVYVDPSGDGQRAYIFGTNPLGVPLDGVRTASSDENDLAWDATWELAACRTGAGWSAEMAIPWRAMRHPERPTAVGLLVTRQRPQNAEKSAWPEISSEAPGWVAQAGKLAVSGPLPRSAGLDLVPELSFGWGSEGPDDGRWSFEGLSAGVTGRWSPSPGFQLGAALNPDFSEVESDDPQITVNQRYALYYEEKRPFFLEGQEWFDNAFGPLVYTRSMVGPRYGVRTTLEDGSWTLSALHVLDAAPAGTVNEGGGWEDEELEGQLAVDTVLRARRALGEGSYLGLTASDKELPGVDLGNRLAAIDGRAQLGESDAIVGAALLSQTTDVDAPGGVSTAAGVSWQHGDRHIESWLDGEWIAPGFRAENGFVTKADWVATGAGFNAFFYPKDTAIRRMSLTPAQGEVAWNTAGVLRAYEWEPEVGLRFGNGLRLHTSVFVEGELFAGSFLHYQQPNIGGGGSVTKWLAVYARAYAGTGPVYDAANPRVLPTESGSVELAVQAGDRVRIRIEGEAEHLHDGDEEVLTDVVGRLRVDAFATPELSARLLLDADTYENVQDGQLLFGWERSPGTAVYLGGGVGLQEGTLSSWSALAKASWSFVL